MARNDEARDDVRLYNELLMDRDALSSVNLSERELFHDNLRKLRLRNYWLYARFLCILADDVEDSLR